MQSDADRWKDGIEDRIVKLEAQVDNLRLWRAATIALGAGIALATGGFAPQVADLLRRIAQ